jgi:hypothetical protein
MRRPIVVAFVLLGCAPVPAPAARPPLVPAPKPEPAVKPESPPELAPPSAPELAEIREPENVACSIAASDWRHAMLRLSTKGPVFAHIDVAPARLVVPVGDAPEAFTAVLDDGQILVRGIVPASEAEIYLRKFRLLGGFAAPLASSGLAVVAGKSNALTVGVDASDVLDSPGNVKEDLACDAFAINIARFDARDSITKRAKLPEKGVGQNGAALAKSPGGEAVAKLKPDVTVSVLETRGASSRVLVESSASWIVGWVATKDIGNAPSHGVGVGYGTGRGLRGAPMGLTLTKCPHDMDVIVEVVGDRVEAAKVGILHAGAHFRVARSEGTERSAGPRLPIELPTNIWLTLEKNARLTVPSSALQDCTDERT